MLSEDLKLQFWLLRFLTNIKSGNKYNLCINQETDMFDSIKFNINRSANLKAKMFMIQSSKISMI